MEALMEGGREGGRGSVLNLRMETWLGERRPVDVLTWKRSAVRCWMGAAAGGELGAERRMWLRAERGAGCHKNASLPPDSTL